MDYTSFIETYFAAYLTKCKASNPLMENQERTPPSSQELKELVAYLTDVGVGFVIGGTLGSVKHLKDVSTDLRPCSYITLFIEQKPPSPPSGWEVGASNQWISPGKGYVLFQVIDALKMLGIDEESRDAGCPVVASTPLIKHLLESTSERDFFELIPLVRTYGLPEEEGLTDQQQKTVKRLKKWMQHE